MTVVIYGRYPFSVRDTDAALRLCADVGRQAVMGAMFPDGETLVFRTGAVLFDSYSAYEQLGRALEYNAGIIVRFWAAAALCAEPAHTDHDTVEQAQLL